MAVRAILLSLIFFTSCGPAAKLRRAERLIEKAEAQGAKWKVDTVYSEIPVIVPSIHIDTVIQRIDFSDTIYIRQNKVVTKIKVDTVNNNVYVSTRCPEQKVTAKVPVIVSRTINAKTWLKWWLLPLVFCAGYIVKSITKVF